MNGMYNIITFISAIACSLAFFPFFPFNILWLQIKRTNFYTTLTYSTAIAINEMQLKRKTQKNNNKIIGHAHCIHHTHTLTHSTFRWLWLIRWLIRFLFLASNVQAHTLPSRSIKCMIIRCLSFHRFLRKKNFYFFCWFRLSARSEKFHHLSYQNRSLKPS